MTDLGETTAPSGFTAYAPSATELYAQKWTLPVGCTLQSMSFYVAGGAAASTLFSGGVYAADAGSHGGTAGQPYTLLDYIPEQTIAQNQAAGWVTASLTGASVAAQDIWLAMYFGATGAQGKLYYVATGGTTLYWIDSPYGAMSSPWTLGQGGAQTYRLGYYITYSNPSYLTVIRPVS